ncbi:CHRD domain-containing protein [Gammaproteobacteria bacterium]|nr:CHRD domain-containing protein [Gammaproteobacteria bacterium]
MKPAKLVNTLRRVFSLCFSLAILVCVISFNQNTARAAEANGFRARLSPMPTTPQTKNTITGSGEVLVSLAGNTLTLTGAFAGMSSVATMAHIHNGPPAQPGPVVAALTATEAMDGELTAKIELTDEQLMALKENALYVQIHSATNPAGELRGWLFAQP